VTLLYDVSRNRQLTRLPLVRRILDRLLRALTGREEVFTITYEHGLWGDQKKEGFYSGPGSESEAAGEYVEYVNGFVRQNNVKRIVDLGCGDFRVGRRFELQDCSYIGCDIVKPVIESNNAQFGNSRISFRHLDIVSDELPEGELCLIRQVLQHLSNLDVMAVLGKLKKYRYVLVTDELPKKFDQANADIRTQKNTRRIKNSALMLERPPFNVPLRVVLLTDYNARYSLRTVLIGKTQDMVNVTPG
jgi:SAM-dependent methyltransferase